MTDIDALAARLWRAEAEDAGTPERIAKGRTLSEFLDQNNTTKARWRKFARAAYEFLKVPMPIKFYAFVDLANRDEETDLPLYWSDDQGWVDESHASLFCEHDALHMRPPMGEQVRKIAVRVHFPIDL